MSEKILIYGAQMPTIKNVGGFRGLRVYGSRGAQAGPWELVLTVPFKFKGEVMNWPNFELEPTQPGGWRYYQWFPYDAQGRDDNRPAFVYELSETDGRVTSLYHWTRSQMIRDGKWDVSREDPSAPNEWPANWPRVKARYSGASAFGG
jgi:hypothetical protein